MANDYFEIDVHGEFFIRVGDNKKELLPYTATFKLPDASAPLSVVVGKLLPPYLRQKDARYGGLYTHHVDEIRCVGRKLEPNEIPIRFQSREQLRGFVKYHKLPIDVDEYGSLGLLRDHVRLAKEEPENFTGAVEKFKKKRQADKALFELNKETLGRSSAAAAAEPAPGRDVETELLS